MSNFNSEFVFDSMSSALYAKVTIENDRLLWSAKMDWDKFKKEIDDYFDLIIKKEREEKKA